MPTAPAAIAWQHLGVVIAWPAGGLFFDKVRPPRKTPQETLSKEQYRALQEGQNCDHGCHNRACCNVVNREHVRQKLGAMNRAEPADWREARTGRRGLDREKVAG
jgi:hypothetical protein